MEDSRYQFSAEEMAQLIAALGYFLEKECNTLCMDDEEDRGTLAGKLAAWLMKDKNITVSPEKLLPKAQYFLSFNVVDETSGDHIIRLVLKRAREMTDGDFLQMQNFFWVTVGRAIRDNQDIIRTLNAGGIVVEIDPPAQPAPGGAFA